MSEVHTFESVFGVAVMFGDESNGIFEVDSSDLLFLIGVEFLVLYIKGVKRVQPF